MNRKGKTFIDVTMGADWNHDKPYTVRIRIPDVAQYYLTQARNITSGCRTIAGITGDWRPIDYIAKDCLEYFKMVNVNGMRKAAKALGMTPRF